MTHTSTLDALRDIYAANGNALTPQAVVDAARDDDHVLHSRFEWDDSVAGERFRLIQAGQMIRSVRVVVEAPPPRGVVEVRPFLSVRETEVGDDAAEEVSWTYRAIEDLTPRGVEVVLEQMQRDVAALRRKYRDHKAVLDRLLLESVEVA